MSELGKIALLIIEVVLLVLRHRYDPERMKREFARRVDVEYERNRNTFRKAIADRDADLVSRMLLRVRDRLRARRGVSPGQREGDPPLKR